jgi:hypothetical protein
MIENVIDNAIRHNQPEGWVRIEADEADGLARLTIESSCPPLQESKVRELALPFTRLSAERTGSDGADRSRERDSALARRLRRPTLCRRSLPSMPPRLRRRRLDLRAYLEPAWRAQLAHAVGHIGLIGALHRISGTDRAPASRDLPAGWRLREAARCEDRRRGPERSRHED